MAPPRPPGGGDGGDGPSRPRGPAGSSSARSVSQLQVDTHRAIELGRPGPPGTGAAPPRTPGEGAVPARPPNAPDDAAPFDAAIAEQVPPYGQRGNKTSGVAVMGDGTQIPLDSGYNTGRSGELPKPRPGMNGNNLSHVEAHTAAEMRLRGIEEATLYINRVPCPGRNGCENLLPRMVPPGGKLTIYGPDGYVRVVYGAPE